MPISVFPTVKQVAAGGSPFKRPELPRVHLPAMATDLPFPEFDLVPDGVAPPGLPPQGYQLELSETRIDLRAADRAGAVNGLLTLRQLCRDEMLPGGTIRDWPDLVVRGYHLDCKAGFPGLEGLYAFARRLIGMKINCLLIEYEDQLPYPHFPELARADSPSREEWRAFLAFVRSHEVQVIPLVQTAGHLDYLLRHAPYAHLMEDGNANEICLSNPEALQTVKQLADDVLDLHEEDEIVHIGADETWFLASCPTCQARLASGLEKLDIYCEHLNAIIDHVKARGFRPMMWCDMFWRGESPDKVKHLPRDVILAEWVYTSERQGANTCFWQGKRYSSDRYSELHPGAAQPPVSSLDPEAQAYLAAHWPTDQETGLGPISAHVSYFQQCGFDVWGISAARSGQPAHRIGFNLASPLDNIICWLRDAATWELPGVICSSWSRSSTFRPPYGPWEAAWLPIAAHAQGGWQTPTDDQSLMTAICEIMFGCQAGEQLAALVHTYDQLMINQSPDRVARAHAQMAALRRQASRGDEYLNLIELGIDYHAWRNQQEVTLTNLEGGIARLRRDKMPAKGRGNLSEHRDGCQAAAERLDRMEARLRTTLEPWFQTDDLDEYVESRLEDLKFRLDNLRKTFIV